MRRLQTYTEKYDGAGRLSGLPLYCRHTMVSKLKLDHNEVPPCFCAKESKERFAKVSSNTPRPHTPCRFKFTLRSLTQVTVLHFVLRLSFYQTHNFFKNVFSLSSGNGFSVLSSFLHTKSYKTPLFRAGKWKKFSRTPFLLQTPHKHPHQLRHWSLQCPESTYPPPNISTPVSWKYAHNYYEWEKSFICKIQKEKF